MAKFKYMEYNHPSGVVVRGDWVKAFVPGEDGTRFVTSAIVTGINQTSIRVEYQYKLRLYSARLLDHQWSFYRKEGDVWLNEHHYEKLVEKAGKYDALEAAGVDNWDGYDAAMDPGF